MRTEYADQLRASGLRVTAQRVAVLAALPPGQHLTADAVADTARGELGAISLQGVYDALASLEDAGLIRRIQPAGSPALFEGRAGDNHHHVICRSCGRVTDVDCAIGTAPCLTPSEHHGYAIDQAEVIYWGRCPSCQIPAP